jgi:hypothetical protein
MHPSKGKRGRWKSCRANACWLGGKRSARSPTPGTGRGRTKHVYGIFGVRGVVRARAGRVPGTPSFFPFTTRSRRASWVFAISRLRPISFRANLSRSFIIVSHVHRRFVRATSLTTHPMRGRSSGAAVQRASDFRSRRIPHRGLSGQVAMAVSDRKPLAQSPRLPCAIASDVPGERDRGAIETTCVVNQHDGGNGSLRCRTRPTRAVRAGRNPPLGNTLRCLMRGPPTVGSPHPLSGKYRATGVFGSTSSSRDRPVSAEQRTSVERETGQIRLMRLSRATLYAFVMGALPRSSVRTRFTLRVRSIGQ